MTQAQIFCFLTVAECGSFSKAAQKLYISQPAVSKQISLAETELGFALFDRARKSIHLTEAGKLFYNLYVNFQNDYNATVRKAQALSNSRQGKVHIGAAGSWDMSHLYTPIYNLFERRYPSISLSWEGYSFDDMLPALKNGSVDVIFVLDSIIKDTPELVRRHLTTIKSILLYSPRHPAAQKDAPTLRDFKDDIFFVPATSAESALRSSTLEQCTRAGFTPQISSISNFTAILLKIQTGGGVMLTDNWMIFKDNPQFRHLDIDFEHTVDICWLDNDANPSKNLFVSELLFSNSQALPGHSIWEI